MDDCVGSLVRGAIFIGVRDGELSHVTAELLAEVIDDLKLFVGLLLSLDGQESLNVGHLLLGLDLTEACTKLPGELLQGLPDVDLWHLPDDAIITGLPAVDPEPTGFDLLPFLRRGMILVANLLAHTVGEGKVRDLARGSLLVGGPIDLGGSWP